MAEVRNSFCVVLIGGTALLPTFSLPCCPMTFVILCILVRVMKRMEGGGPIKAWWCGVVWGAGAGLSEPLVALPLQNIETERHNPGMNSFTSTQNAKTRLAGINCSLDQNP